MQAYMAIAEMLDHAHYSEAPVIRAVAKRAGVMWTCIHARCARDNVGEGDTCEHCGYPAPEEGLRPGEWRCVCRAANWGARCRVCHRDKPYLRSAQLYS